MPNAFSVYSTMAWEESYLMSTLSAVISLFGIVGSVLLLATLHKNQAFKDPYFVCYKAFGLSGLVYAVADTFRGIHSVSGRFSLP